MKGPGNDFPMRKVGIFIVKTLVGGLLSYAAPRFLLAIGVPLDEWIVKCAAWFSIAISNETAVWGATTALCVGLIGFFVWADWRKPRLAGPEPHSELDSQKPAAVKKESDRLYPPGFLILRKPEESFWLRWKPEETLDIITAIDVPGEKNRNPQKLFPTVTLKNLGDTSAKNIKLLYQFIPTGETSLDDCVLASERFKQWRPQIFKHKVPLLNLPVRHKALSLMGENVGRFVHQFSMIEMDFLDHLIQGQSHSFTLKQNYTAAEIYLLANLPNGGPQCATNALLFVDVEYEDIKGNQYHQEFWISIIARSRVPLGQSEAIPTADYSVAASLVFDIQERVRKRLSTQESKIH